MTIHFVIIHNTTYLRENINKNEPRHDKTNKMSVRPAKTPPSPIRVFAVRSMDS